MKQEINLVTCLPQEKPKPFMFRQICTISGIFLFLLLLFSGISLWKTKFLDKEYQSLSNQAYLMDAKLKALKKNHASLIEGEVLLQQLSQFSDSIEAKKNIVSILSSRKSIFNIEGFSQYFTVLAKNTLTNVWLTKIQIKAGGEKMVLLGNAKQSSDVLAYISKLNETAMFVDRPFRLSQLTHGTSKASGVGFTIVSTLAKDGA